MTKMTASKYRKLVLSNKPLPANVKIDGDLNLFECTSLTTLPEGLNVGGDLHLNGCTSLTTLPEGLEVGGDLSLYSCTSLTTLPKGLKVGGHMNLCGCTSLTHLPKRLKVGGGLHLFRCTSLRIDEYGLGDIGGWVWVDESFFKNNKDHLLSLVNYKWGYAKMERWYKEAFSRE